MKLTNFQIEVAEKNESKCEILEKKENSLVLKQNLYHNGNNCCLMNISGKYFCYSRCDWTVQYRIWLRVQNLFNFIYI